MGVKEGGSGAGGRGGGAEVISEEYTLQEDQL